MTSMISPLKSQVVSLELSKRLKELGVPQNSLFYWLTYESEDGKWGLEPMLKYGKDISGRIDNTSAFLVGELGEMLPRAIEWKIGKEERVNFALPRPLVLLLPLTPRKHHGLWSVSYQNVSAAPEFRIYGHGESAETEADARAKMLIYLLENNLIKASDL